MRNDKKRSFRFFVREVQRRGYLEEERGEYDIINNHEYNFEIGKYYLVMDVEGIGLAHRR